MIAANRSRPRLGAELRSGAGTGRGWRVATVVLAVVVQLVAWCMPVSASGPAETWTGRSPATDNFWTSVTYGNGLFVAVATSGTGNRVMTSPDGTTWTTRASAADLSWNSVTYGNGLFVAVAGSGTGNRVMTSPDGTTWTTRASAADNSWNSVTYGNGLFVAVAGSGTGNRVMTSPDGTTWTLRASAANNSWTSVTYGNGLFVAVAGSGTGNRVMTSPDGTTWTLRTSAADNNWTSIAYGNGLFVAVAGSGTGNRVMTSPDGINWTLRTSAADNSWTSIAYGNDLFVAIALLGPFLDRLVMTSGTTVTPVFSAPASAADGFTVNVSNYLADLTWNPSAESGTVTSGTVSGSALPLTVTGLAPGASTTVTVSVTRNGFTYGIATVTGTALPALANPTFSTPTSTADGFTVDITNYPYITNYLAGVTVNPSAESGTVTSGTVSGSALPLTVTGLAPGASTTVTVSVTRNGFTYGIATVTGSALPAPLPPAIPLLPDPSLIRLPASTTPPTTTIPDTTAPPSTTVPDDLSNPDPSTPPSLDTVLALPAAPLLPTSVLNAGEPVSITVSGFQPDEPVMLVIASTPRILATGRADAQGVARLTGAVPTDMTTGPHTLAVIAPGSGTGFRQPITLTPQQLPQTGTNTPMFIVFVMLLAGFGVLAARRQYQDYQH